jgi:hypothetical protein
MIRHLSRKLIRAERHIALDEVQLARVLRKRRHARHEVAVVHDAIDAVAQRMFVS